MLFLKRLKFAETFSFCSFFLASCLEMKSGYSFRPIVLHIHKIWVHCRRYALKTIFLKKEGEMKKKEQKTCEAL